MTIPQALAKLLQPDESAYDMLRRAGAGALKGQLPSLGFDDLDAIIQNNIEGIKEQPCYVIEVEGDSGLGKSFLLMTFAAKFAESGGSVWYFDLDQRLAPDRFARFFKDEEHMSRVSVFTPATSKQLLASLHQLSFEDDPVRLVIVDSLLAFYQMNVLTDPLGAGFFFSFPHRLFDLAGRLGFVVAASKPSVPFDIVSKTWSQGVSYKLILTSRGTASVRLPASRLQAQPSADAILGELGFELNK